MNMPENQSHPKDIWSKNSTSPYEIFWPKLKVPSLKCSSEYNRCGLTKVILYSHPKTNSSHMSGVSCPQKETHLFQSQLFLCCYFGFFLCSKFLSLSLSSLLHQAATKGGTRMMFGQEMKVKPQPAKTVVKAFPASQLKSQIWGHLECW